MKDGKKKRSFIEIFSEKVATMVQLFTLYGREEAETQNVFALLGGSSAYRCPSCGFLTYSRVISGSDRAWNNAPLHIRALSSKTEHVCFNTRCDLYGRPKTQSYMITGEMDFHIPTPYDEIKYLHNDPTVGFVRGGPILIGNFGDRPLEVTRNYEKK